MKLRNLKDAQELFQQLGAPQRLVLHSELVSETANQLADHLEVYNLQLDKAQIVVGAFIHDIGKIQYLEELNGGGNKHEQAGQQLLLEKGAPEHIARHCVSHAQFDRTCCLEQLVVALADKLWKGKRHQNLESMVIKAVSQTSKQDHWDVFIELDAFFELLASKAPQRLLLTQRQALHD